MDHAAKYLLRQRIAAALDFPSVYMGGPSQQSVRKAIMIVNDILQDFSVTPLATIKEDIARIKEWRSSEWDSLERT